MLDHSSKTSEGAASAAPGASDTLTEILLGLRLEGVEYGRCVAQAPWAVTFAAQPAARFHFVARGDCWLQKPGGEWLRLRPGDAVLLPHGSAHALASSPEVPGVEAGTLERVSVADNLYLVQNCGAKAAGTDANAGEGCTAPSVVFSGVMRFNLDPLHPLITMMPSLMLAGDLARSDPTVPALLEAMEREVALERIGACGIMARMADVLAASIIRAWVECGCNASTGWVAAVRCPQIGKVVAAIHADPARAWDVPTLAGLMGASRSKFAQAFTRLMGESPAKYVTKVKMFQARHWIAHDGLRMATVAARLGYESEASFSRAFKRIVGAPPSTARRALSD